MYKNWKNVPNGRKYPEVKPSKKGVWQKQENPTEKKGIIGAFCRTYSITQAMEQFIPGMYEQTDIPNRYTYTGGTTTGGAILYDGDLFLYSHHASRIHAPGSW